MISFIYNSRKCELIWSKIKQAGYGVGMKYNIEKESFGGDEYILVYTYQILLNYKLSTGTIYLFNKVDS